MVEPAPARLGDLLVDGVAHERVPEGHAVAGRDHELGLKRGCRRLLGILDGQPPELDGLDRACRDRRDLDQSTTVLGKRSQRRPHQPAQAGRDVGAPPAERPRGLHREQRVAFGQFDHPFDVGLAQTGRLAGQRRRWRRRQRLQLELARQQPARAERVLQTVGVGAVGQFSTGEHHHHPQPGHPPRGIRGQLEAGRVGAVDVLEHEQHRCLAGGPREQRDDRLEQSGALQVGRDRDARRSAAPEVRRQLGCEDGQIVGPRRFGGRRRDASAAAHGSARPTG